MKRKFIISFVLSMIAATFSIQCAKPAGDGDIIVSKKKGPCPEGAVDLGLSVYWGTCNIGSSTPEGYGDYYAWGDTEEMNYYDWKYYKWCEGSSESLTKYNTLSKLGTVDNKTTLEPDDDVAHVKLGGRWRMPTNSEMQELIDYCDWTVVFLEGVRGFEVKSKTNDNSIFLPLAGMRGDNKYLGQKTDGNYWSSSVDEIYPTAACLLKLWWGIGNDNKELSRVELYDTRRDDGFTVRAVSE